VRKKVPTRDGVAILGCGMCCRAENVNDANQEAPEQDVLPPYAAAPATTWSGQVPTPVWGRDERATGDM